MNPGTNTIRINSTDNLCAVHSTEIVQIEHDKPENLELFNEQSHLKIDHKLTRQVTSELNLNKRLYTQFHACFQDETFGNHHVRNNGEIDPWFIECQDECPQIHLGLLFFQAVGFKDLRESEDSENRLCCNSSTWKQIDDHAGWSTFSAGNAPLFVESVYTFVDKHGNLCAAQNHYTCRQRFCHGNLCLKIFESQLLLSSQFREKISTKYAIAFENLSILPHTQFETYKSRANNRRINDSFYFQRPYVEIVRIPLHSISNFIIQSPDRVLGSIYFYQCLNSNINFNCSNGTNYYLFQGLAMLLQDIENPMPFINDAKHQFFPQLATISSNNNNNHIQSYLNMQNDIGKIVCNVFDHLYDSIVTPPEPSPFILSKGAMMRRNLISIACKILTVIRLIQPFIQRAELMKQKTIVPQLCHNISSINTKSNELHDIFNDQFTSMCKVETKHIIKHDIEIGQSFGCSHEIKFDTDLYSRNTTHGRRAKSTSYNYSIISYVIGITEAEFIDIYDEYTKDIYVNAVLQSFETKHNQLTNNNNQAKLFIYK